MSAEREDASDSDPTACVQHRPPILAIDRVVRTGPEGAIAERTVTAGPEVDAEGALWEQVLIEGIAQTAAALHSRSAKASGRTVARGMLVGMNRVSLVRNARVDERVEFRVELIRELRPLSLVHGSAWVKGELLAEGDFKFYVEDAP